MKSRLPVMLACCLAWLVFSCKQKAKEITGKWEVTDFSIETAVDLNPSLVEAARASEIGSFYEFMSDGDYIQQTRQGHFFTGTWKYDNKLMKLEINMLSEDPELEGESVQVTYDITQLSKDELRFQFQDNIGKYSYILKKIAN